MGACSLHPYLLYFLLLFLTSYVMIDLLANHSDFTSLVCSSPPLRAPSLPLDHSSSPPLDHSSSPLLRAPSLPLDHSSCTTRDAHFLTNFSLSPDPWRQMKWVGRAAPCRINGHLIEALDDENNFRRGFALKFAGDVEDKTHVLPWLLAARVNLNQRKRRVYVDLGANAFSTSISWFLRMYPCDFTEVHAFEVDRHLLRKPQEGFNEDSNYASPNRWSLMVKQMPGIPKWMLDRVNIYYKFVSDRDNETNREINITRFMKEELKLKASDAVVVKMDIEGSEWPILRRWMEDPEMASIVDELFVEVHYEHPSMWGYHWVRFAPTSRQDAKRLLADLRWRGFFAHAWP